MVVHKNKGIKNYFCRNFKTVLSMVAQDFILKNYVTLQNYVIFYNYVNL